MRGKQETGKKYQQYSILHVASCIRAKPNVNPPGRATSRLRPAIPMH